MNIITRIRQLAETAAGSVQGRVDDLQKSKRRRELLMELGELTYRKHQGDPIDETATNPVLDELDRLGADSPAEREASGRDDEGHAPQSA